MQLSSLQAGRAFAALLVVLYHLNGSIFGLPKYHPEQFSPLLSFGYAGVEFFFVLSGFVMVLAHQKPGDVGSFAWKRFVRIYPIYWVVLLPLLAAFFVVPGFGAGFKTEPGAILTALTLAPTPIDGASLTVAWTLQREVLFYALFAFALYRPKWGVQVMAAWLAGGLLAYVVDLPFPASFVFSHYNLLFALGMGTAWLYLRGWSVPGLLVGGAVGFLALGIGSAFAELPRAWLSLGFGLSASAAVLGAASLERAGRLTAPSWLRLLGDASYSIYLTHFPALSALAKVWAALGLWSLAPWVSFGALFLAVVTGGVAFHLLVERPLLNRLRRFPARPKLALAA